MTAPIQPVGATRQRKDLPASMEVVKLWMLRERERIAETIETKLWLVPDGNGQYDIGKSVTNLANAVRSAAKDNVVFEEFPLA